MLRQDDFQHALRVAMLARQLLARRRDREDVKVRVRLLRCAHRPIERFVDAPLDGERNGTTRFHRERQRIERTEAAREVEVGDRLTRQSGMAADESAGE